MLHSVIGSTKSGWVDVRKALSSPSLAPSPADGESFRYGRRPRPNLPAIAFILVLHAGAIAALVEARTQVVRATPERLTVINLSQPPPPPASEAPPPPPSAPRVVAPPPIVRTPVLSTPVQTTPEPMPVVAADAPSPPVPSPVVSAAPAAPPSIMQGGDLGAQMVSGKPPRYPMECRRRHEQGTVILSLTLGLDGTVEAISIAQSSGSHRLDDAARDAVKNWRWKPFLRSGQAVKVRGQVEIPFVLRTEA